MLVLILLLWVQLDHHLVDLLQKVIQFVDKQIQEQKIYLTKLLAIENKIKGTNRYCILKFKNQV